MAAIYAFIPVSKVYYTSTPYPIYAIDELTEEQDIIDLFMIQENMEGFTISGEVLSGTLEHQISYGSLDAGEDYFTISGEVLSGTLTPIIGYVELDAGLDNFTMSGQVLSGTLTTTINYIYITQPPDNVVEDMNVLGITLTPA